ncbi:MAG: hypothetical protein DRP78_07275, partial [Candidatus Omnitrophota bacterium]
KNSKIIKNKPQQLIDDLDCLPWPLREQLPLDKYLDAPGGIPLPCATMWASRGCPFKCTFCLWPQIMYRGSIYRARKVKNVVDEMEYLVKKLGFKSIYFDDDTWNVGRQRIVEFCSELQKRRLKIPWAIMARADLMDDELLRIMRKSGLFAVKYGIESSSQKLVDNIQKGLDLKKAWQVIKYTQYLGIKIHLTFTFGLPGENKKTITETIKYALKLDPTSVQFSLATPFPGTKFYEQMDKAGYILTKQLEKFDGNHSSVIRTDTLSAKQLQQAKDRAYLEWNQHCKLKYCRKCCWKFCKKAVSFLLRAAFFLLQKIKSILVRVPAIPVTDSVSDCEKIESISLADIKLIFVKGRVELYWKNHKITKDVGLNTSLYCGGNWTDSSKAKWKIEKQKENKVSIYLAWDNSPARQKWEINIMPDQTILWKVKIYVEKDLEILEYKAGIMLQEGYNSWKDDLGIGLFPRITGWEEIELYNSKTRSLYVMANLYLPELELKLASDVAIHTYAQIQNTNKDIKARILQMRRFRVDRFVPAKSDCFYLEIKLKGKNVAPQSIANYKKRVPFKFIKEKVGEKGILYVLNRIFHNLHPKKVNDFYLDILGVLDTNYAYKGPSFVQIDLTNNCNNNCIGCWCNSPLLKDRRISQIVKSQTLPLSVVKKLLDELALMGTKEIYLAGGGEPFMHPQILEIVKYIKAKGLRCYINTNFTLLNEDMVKSLVDLGVDNLIVSVWAGTAKVYSDTHPNKNEAMFYQIKGMLKLLNALKNNNFSHNKPQTNIYNVISNLNYKDLEAMFDFALETGADSLEFTVIDTIPGATDKLLLTEQQRQVVLQSCEKIKQRLLKEKINVQQFAQFIRRMQSRVADEANYDEDILAEMPCYIGWLFARILADGNVNFCLKAHRIPVGNIY